MAPKNTVKEAMRFQEAKDAIRKMKMRRRDGKKGDARGVKVNPTVKALIAASVSSSKTSEVPEESLVVLRSKPTISTRSKKGASKLLPNVAKSEYPSPVNGSQNGLGQNGQQPLKTSKKSSMPTKKRDTKIKPQVFDSPSVGTDNSLEISICDIPGVSTACEDQDYSPHVRPSGIGKVYVSKKNSGSVSSISSEPFDIHPMHLNARDFLNSKNSPRIPLVDQDQMQKDYYDNDKIQPAVPKERKKKTKKSLKISKSSLNIRKKSAPMSIKKTSSSVKFPAFSVSLDDITSRSDLKTTQLYKNKQKGTVKSGSFSVTTVSEPVISERRDDEEDEVSLDENDVDRSACPESDEEYEDVVEEHVQLNNSSENIPYNNSSGVQFHFIDGQVILHLEHPSTFTFCGQVQVKVLKGAVEVLGHLLNSSNGYHTVFSLPGIGLLPLQSVPSNENPDENRIDSEFSYLVDTLFREGKPDDVFLLMKKSESVLPFFVSQFIDLQLFPSKNDAESDTLFSKASRKLQCLCDPPEGSNIVKRGELWDQISENIILNPGCTVLCGGKGVGKSTLLRFITNRLLSNGNDTVVVMDFDPGQAELTIPGCVSLAVVKKPMLGPNFTHLENPLKCIYTGEINVSNSVSRYMDACLTIISYWQSDENLRNIPCIVNTMGFTRGIGVTIMVQLLSALQPTRVVQILSPVSEFNYPEVMSVEYVKKSCVSSPFTINLDSTMHTQRHSLFSRGSLNFETHVIRSGTELGRNVHNLKGFDPRRRREAVILSYLSQMVSPPNFSILDIVPYSCPLDSLYLHICHESVPPEVTLSAFNASLVALCSVNPPEQDVVQLPESGFPNIITKRFIVDCLGFGVVRGIDMETRLLYLLTPVPTNILTSVNCLVLGAVNLPSSLFFSPPREVGAVPYVIQNAK